MPFLHRLLLVLIAASTLYYVLNFVEPPTSWPEASTTQILIFYLPLLTTITLLINIFINNILRSFVAGLGIIFALTLLGAKQLTPFTAAITFFITGIIFVHTPSIRFIHYRKLRKITHLKKEPHHKKEEHHPKVLKRL